MSHSKISSVAEPWLLLPLMGMLKKEGTASVYSHHTSQMAIEDLIGNIRGSVEQYRNILRQFVLSVYDSASDSGSVYFLDKTPRYYMIIPEIAELFPEARFIFLFRNPVHVYASILATWGKGTLRRVFHHAIDLNEGPARLSSGYDVLKEKAFAMQYETFVQDPKRHLRSLVQYLDLPYEEHMLKNFGDSHTRGRMGDKTGASEYRQVDKMSLEKWRNVFDNRFRKRLLKAYISRIPESVLVKQGYDKSSILDEIDALKVKLITPPRDYLQYGFSKAAIYFRIHLFLAEEMSWATGKHLD